MTLPSDDSNKVPPASLLKLPPVPQFNHRKGAGVRLLFCLTTRQSLGSTAGSRRANMKQRVKNPGSEDLSATIGGFRGLSPLHESVGVMEPSDFRF